MSTTSLITAEQLLQMPDDGCRHELVSGELKKMPPASWEHGAVGGRLHTLLGHHVLEHRLGEVFEGETGFLLARDPDTVRASDIAFVAADRIAAAPRHKGFWAGPPDLAVEVVSPGDTQREIDEKVMAWLDTGTKLVWVVNPAWYTVTVYRSRREIRTLTENEELSGEDVVPGFRCLVGVVFVGM